MIKTIQIDRNKKYPYISCYNKTGLLGYFKNKNFEQIQKHFKLLKIEYITIIENKGLKVVKNKYNTEGELIQ